MMKRFLFLALAGIAGWLANNSVATAGAIVPSGPAATPTGLGTPASPLLTSAGYAGLIVADSKNLGTINYTFGGGVNTGTVEEIVVKDTLNPYSTAGDAKLSFIFQVHVATGDITRLTNSNYPNNLTILTDVAQGPGGTGTAGIEADPFVAGSRAAASANRTPSAVGFNFDPAILSTDPTTTTLALIIRTNTDNYGTGFIGLIDGGGFSTAGYAPLASPEPASVVLLGFGAAGMLGYGWKRRKAIA